jgi:hypothetical protein
METTKPRKGSRRWYVAELDDTTRQIVKFGATRCITCPETRIELLECSHFMRRGWDSTRFDIDPRGNNHVQCQTCNRAHNTDRGPYESWFMRSFGGVTGLRIIEELEKRARGRQLTIIELDQKLSEHKAILKNMRVRSVMQFANKPYSNQVPF